jgi:hypothetical protein
LSRVAALHLLDHLVGEREQPVRYLEAERLGGLEIKHEFELLDCMTGRSAGFSPLRIRPASCSGLSMAVVE